MPVVTRSGASDRSRSGKHGERSSRAGETRRRVSDPVNAPKRPRSFRGVRRAVQPDTGAALGRQDCLGLRSKQPEESDAPSVSKGCAATPPRPPAMTEGARLVDLDDWKATPTKSSCSATRPLVSIIGPATSRHAHPTSLTDSSANEFLENTLRQFDLDMRYGPCVGLSRLRRWERAQALGLQPPSCVRDLLTSSVPQTSPIELLEPIFSFPQRNL